MRRVILLALALVWGLAAALTITPLGWAALAGAALLIMTPGLVQCARLRRWP